MTTPNRLAAPAALVALVALIALGACSATRGSDAGGAGEAVEPAAGSADRSFSDGGGDSGSDSDGDLDGGSDDGGGGADPAVGPDEAGIVTALDVERSVISTAVVSLRADDAAAARADVMRIVDVHRGQVSDEETSTDDEGRVERSRLVLRVPAADFAETVAELEDVAELVSSDKSSEDVSFQVIDTRVRIRAQEQSLRRIELLLDRARSIRDIVSIESELTRRQAELDALKSKQDYLADQTAYATITVHLERAGAAEPERPDREESGFLAGLDGGWKALAAFATVLATIVGALLPWLVLLGVLGAPTWLLMRRSSRRRAPATPAAPLEG